MEDILASIKRIIAEDSEAVGVRAPRLRREAMEAVSSSSVVAPADVEKPREAEADETEQAAPVAATPQPRNTDAERDVLELTSPLPEATAQVSTPESATLVGLNGLVSASAAQASRNAFAALSQLQVRSEGGQDNTLEGLVTDLLRPMLREWLDRELPALVERMVAAEIARLSRRG